MTYRPLVLLVLLSLLSGCAVYDHVFHPHRLGNPPMTAAAQAKAKAAEKARHKGLTLGAPAADGSAKPANADGTDDGATAPAPAADAKSADDKNKAIADMLGNTYDTKTGLLKRSKLQRMQYSSRALHHYDLRAPSHTDATRDARHLRKHPKGKDSDKAARKGAEANDAAAAADPGLTPDPTQPAVAPTAKAVAAPKATPKAAKAPLAKTPVPKPVKATSAKPKAKVDKAAEAKIKEEKLRAGGEKVDRPAKAPKEPKDKKASKAPKPDPTQPLTGQD